MQQYWGFRVLMILLSVSFTFILVAMVTKNWWMNEDIPMNAGLWEKCEDITCTSYDRTTMDRSLRKLSKLNFNVTKMKHEDDEHQDSDLINTVRILTVFSLVVLGISAFMSGVYVYLLTSRETKRISTFPQIVLAILILLAAVTSLSSVMCATNHKKIFGMSGMKVAGSWVAMLIGSIIVIVVGVVYISSIFCGIYKKRFNNGSTSNGFDSVFSSNSNSRKTSKSSADHSVIANNNNDCPPPYTSLQQFNDNNHCEVDGPPEQHAEHEYKIPDVNEVQTSFHQSPTHLPGIIEDSDITIAKLSDFSSEPSTVVANVPEDSEGGVTGDLTSGQRATSFENILYAVEQRAANNQD